MWSAAWVHYISIVLKLAYNKNKLYILNFDFLEKDLGIVSPPYFVYDFLTKMCLMLFSIN